MVNLPVSDKTGDSSGYMLITELPTGFRSYDVSQVWVRGLFYEEATSLSKYVSDHSKDFLTLYNIYSDVIKGIDILDLELVDFTILMILSSIHTVKDFGWIPNLDCGHEGCEGKILRKIVLEDFEFKDPKVDKLPVEVSWKDSKTLLGALTVGDVIEKNSYLEKNPEESSTFLNYASMIKKDIPLGEKLKLVKYGSLPDVKQISELDKDILIQIDPLIKTCNKAGHKNRVIVGLDKIQAYP